MIIRHRFGHHPVALRCRIDASTIGKPVFPLIYASHAVWFDFQGKLSYFSLNGRFMIDDTWPARFPDVLAEQLRDILADPEG